MSEQRDIRRVRVVFDAIAQRWELADDGFGGRGELEVRDDGVSIGRTASGTVVELVIDADDASGASEHAGETPPVALQLVRENFGPQVADLVGRGTPDRDVEVVIDVVDVPARTPVAHRAAPPIAAGEPGIPTPRSDGSYAVPSGRTVLMLEVFADRLVIRAPRGAASADSWAVVATADAGDVVAMGPMESSGDGGTSAHLAFGLPLAPDELFVATTTDPLAPIDERPARQRRWAFELLDQAEADLRLRPARAARAANTAQSVGAALGDDRVIDRAARVARRARRRRWFRAGGATVGIAAIVTGVVLLTGDDGQPTPTTPTESTVYFANCDAARAAGPTPLHRDDPGYRSGLDRDGDGIACEG